MRVRKTLTTALQRRIWSRLYIDPGDYRRTVLLAGTGRSGTTWIEDVINCASDYRVMFEPFHAYKIPLLRDWSYRQYLRPEEHAARFLAPATRILCGQIRDGWIDQFNTVRYVRRRLVKDIRANLILYWIRRHFPEIPIVLLLRHPCAVASSKLALHWNTHLDDFLRQPELIEDHLGPFVADIREASDPFERHIFMWCVENYVPLRQFSPGEIHVAFYEHFCRAPQEAAHSLFRYLGNALRPEVFAVIHKPSVMSRARSAVVVGDSVLEGWRRHIDSRRIERANEILRLFGLERIYGASSLPLVTGDEALDLIPAQDGARRASTG